MRLDTELVRRGLARSRTQAARLIAEERVAVSGRPVTKPAARVETREHLAVLGGSVEFASRGAHKLLGALDAFDVAVSGRRALDAGASTGGFTDVLLRRGAASVLAIDVGAGQLVPRLRDDPRVRVLDKVNVRTIHVEQIGEPVELIVADLSFISLRLVLPALFACAADDADVLPMVKPQFEVGKGRVDASGVVRDPALRAAAVLGVVKAAQERGWGTRSVVASPLPGPHGNVEYFLHLRRGAPIDIAAARVMVQAAIRQGPQ